MIYESLLINLNADVFIYDNIPNIQIKNIDECAYNKAYRILKYSYIVETVELTANE